MSFLRIKNIYLTYILFSILLLFISLNLISKYNYLSPDAAVYCSAALNIYNGQGYKDANYGSIFQRPPLFPSILALSFFIFSPSLWVASFIPKISFCLSALVIFWLGKKIFGLWEGFFGALLILSSKLLNQLSIESILLDETQALFNLIFVLACFLALEKNSFKFYLIAGLSLSLSYLTKETALVGIPLLIALILLFKNYRSRRHFYGFFIFLASFLFIGYLPWKIYMNINKASSYFMQDALNIFSIDKFFNYKMNPFLFLKNSIIPVLGLVLFLLFIFSWLVAIYFSLKGNRTYTLLIISFFLFVGLVAHVSLTTGYIDIGGPRFFLTGYFLSYLLVARILFFPIKWGYERSKKINNNFKYFILFGSSILLISLASFQLWKVSPYWYERTKHGSFKNWDTNLMKVGEWINKNLPRRPLYVNSPWYGRIIHFTSAGHPIYFSNLTPKKIENYDSSEGALININLPDLDSENNITVVSEKDLFNDINTGRVKYIITYLPNWYHSIDLYNTYLEKSENFRLIETIKGDEPFKIYEIKKTKKISNDNSIYFKKQEFIDQIRNIYDRDKIKYMKIKNHIFNAGLANLLCELERKIEKLSPAYKMNINFENQIEFLGFDFESENKFDFNIFNSPLCPISLSEPLFKLGEKFTLSYFWKSKNAAETGEYWIYGDIQKSNNIIPITHQLAENGNFPVINWNKETVVKESYEYKIPEIAEIGPYEINMSVFATKSKRAIGKLRFNIIRIGNPVDVSYSRANILKQKGYEKEALREYMRIVEEYPVLQKNHETYKEKHFTDLTIKCSLKALKEAVNELEKVAEIYSDKADFHYLLGLGFEKLGEQSKALKFYNNAITMMPDHLKSHHQKGLIYYKQGNIEVSIKEFEQVISLSPTHLETLAKLFEIYKNINAKGKMQRIKYLGEMAASKTLSKDNWENSGSVLAGNGISFMKIDLFLGNIEIKINASGSLAGGIGPHFIVRLDGEKIGEVDNMREKEYLFKVENIKSGSHFLSVEFTNDANIDGQDRNLFLGDVSINYGSSDISVGDRIKL